MIGGTEVESTPTGRNAGPENINPDFLDNVVVALPQAADAPDPWI